MSVRYARNVGKVLQGMSVRYARNVGVKQVYWLYDFTHGNIYLYYGIGGNISIMENKKGGDLICRRPEAIIEARFNLTKKQNDIVDMVFASIEDDGKLEYQIDLTKYGKLYNIKDKSNIYRDLKKAVCNFEGKGFSLSTKNWQR